MTEKNPVFSEEEQTRRLWDKEEIKNTLNRHSYLLAADARQKELDTLWVQDPAHQESAILGYNNGYYTGFDNITQHYVRDAHGLREKALKAYCEKDPSIPFSEENIGLGFMAMHTANTPLIEIAGDGETARFLGYDCGLYCVGNPNGSDSYFTFGRIYCDLAREKGKYKIWHLLLTYDHIIPAGKDYGDIPPNAPWGQDLVEQACGTPTIPDVVYDAFYGWTDMWERLPRPYATYTPENSYSPDGKPACYKIGLYK